MAKELGLDSQGVQKVMRKRDYVADGLGMVSLNSISGLVGMLTYFYTDKVGVAAAMVANVLLVTKVLDAFTDLIMGRLLDQTKSKYGKARPWFLRMILPVIVALVALFTVPSGLSSGLQFAYLLATNFFATAVVYTAIAIPYNALIVYRTNSVDERGKMGIVRAGFGYLIGMVIAILLIPISNMLGGDQAAWVKLGMMFAVISGLSLVVLFKYTREVNLETPAQEAKEQIPFSESIQKLFKNKYWVLMLGLSVVSNVSFGLSGASGAYYAKWVLGSDNFVGILGLVGLVPSLLGFLIVGPMVKRLGISKSMLVALAMGIVVSAVRVFFPASFELTVVAGFFGTFATIPVMALGSPLMAMTIDYNDYLYGMKMTGMASSANSFGAKIGTGVGASLVGWCLAVGAYDATAQVQSASAIQAIYTFSIYIPLLLLVGLYLFVKLLQPLEKEYGTILQAIHERNEGK